MKRLFVFKRLIVLSAFTLLMLCSCEKDQQEQTVSSKHGFNVSLINPSSKDYDSIGSYLYFPTEDDYQECLDYLIQLDEDGLNLFESEMNFTSMRSHNAEFDIEDTIDDPILETFLNSNGYFRVGDSLFNIDVDAFVTTVYPMQNNSIVDSFVLKGDLYEDDSKCCGEDNTSIGIKHQHYRFRSGNYSTLAFISYRNYGVYHSLVSVLKDEDLRREKHMHIAVGSYSRFWDDERIYFGPFDKNDDIGTQRKLHKTAACTAFRRMRDYYLKVKFTVEPESSDDWEVTETTLILPPQYPQN